MVDGVRVDHLVESIEVVGVDELRHALQRCDVVSLVI